MIDLFHLGLCLKRSSPLKHLFSFLCKAEPPIRILHSPIDGQLGCFPLLARGRRAAMNIHVQISGGFFLFLIRFFE